MSNRAQRICILGGGFGGLYAALRLAAFPWQGVTAPEIVLVDRGDRFVFLPLLYEIISGELQSWEIAPPFTEVLAETRVRFIRAEVMGIDFSSRDIHLEGRPSLRYDYLVLATGVQTLRLEIPGLSEHALEFRSLEDAYTLDERLRELEASERETIRIAIVGGSYSGIELACKLADRLGERGRLRIIELADGLLRTATAFNREAAQRALEARGIWIDLETQVSALTAASLTLAHRETEDELPVDLTIWTAGTQIPAWVQQLSLPQSDRGQIEIEPTLQVKGYAEVFALGDIATCCDADGQQMPPTAQVAFQQSDFCAWNLWAAIAGRPLLPFRYQPLGEMVSLGINDASLTTLGDIKLEGTAAHLLRRLAYLYRMPTLKHQLTVGSNWIAQPLLSPLGG
ncbi:MAG: NAD(P)/FAD-dependent oxidoreductase [Cyanobacteria bacterium J06641_5]